MIAGYVELKSLDRITVTELIESITIGKAIERTGGGNRKYPSDAVCIGNLLENTKEDIA